MVKTGNLFLIIILAFSLIALAGCTETNIQTPPFTTSQFVSRATDLNYSNWLNGDYNNMVLVFDGNKISVADANDLNVALPDMLDYVSWVDGNSTYAYKSDVSNLVPYTGASKNINLNSKNISNASDISATNVSATNEFKTNSLLRFADTSGTNKWHWQRYVNRLTVTETGVAERFVIQEGTGNVGVGTNAPTVRLDVAGSGKGALPPTSGTTPTANSAFGFANENQRLFIGTNPNSPYGSWLQAANKSNLASEYPLYLNPNGGAVSINTTDTSAAFNVSGNSYFGDGNIYVDGYVHANGYITNSVIADSKSGESSLKKLDNIREWIDSKGNIDYSKHYAGKEYSLNKVTGYKKELVDDLNCSFIYDKKTGELLIDDTGNPLEDCVKVSVLRDIPVIEEVTEQGLDLEVRVAEMEKMIWELKNALCKTDPSHVFCK
jgi:hypothetical protein